MIKDIIDKYFENVSRNPFNIIWTTLGTILVFVGVSETYYNIDTIYGELISTSFLWTLLLIIVLNVIVYFMLSIFLPYKLGGVSNTVIHKMEQHWHINRDGSRNIAVKKCYTHFKKPDAKRMFDTVFGSLELDIDALEYKSGDSDIQYVKKTRSDAYNIYWQPKSGPLSIGQFYTHEFSLKYPKGDTADEKSFTLASVTPAHIVKLIVSSDVKIASINIRKDTTRIKFWKYASIAKTGGDIYDTLIVKRSKKKFTVVIENIRPNDVYFVVVKFESKNKKRSS